MFCILRQHSGTDVLKSNVITWFKKVNFELIAQEQYGREGRYSGASRRSGCEYSKHIVMLLSQRRIQRLVPLTKTFRMDHKNSKRLWERFGKSIT